MIANNSPAGFTDEDLTCLKDFVRNMVIRRELDGSGDETILFKYKMESLLARLESAEKAIRHLLVVCQDDRESYEYSEGILSEAEDAMDNWRISSAQEPLGHCGLDVNSVKD